jgi:hypothetical protein
MELKLSFHDTQQAAASLCAHGDWNRAKMRGPKQVITFLSTKQPEKTVHLCAVFRLMREKYETKPFSLLTSGFMSEKQTS